MTVAVCSDNALLHMYRTLGPTAVNNVITQSLYLMYTALTAEIIKHIAQVLYC